MPIIRFSHDWNGKITSNNEIFTTIRNYTPEKMEYYLTNLNKKFSVMLKNKKVGEATLVYVEEDRMGSICFPLLAVDTGIMDPNEVYKLFEKFGIKWGGSLIVLVFKKIQKDSKSAQRWWN